MCSMTTRIAIASLLLWSVGCSESRQEAQAPAEGSPESTPVADGREYTEDREACARYSELRMPLFGDVHVHTGLSFDAVSVDLGSTPADAYRYAKGETIPGFPIGDKGRPQGSMQIDRPLDFLAVTDHGEFLGETNLCLNPQSPRYDSEACQAYRADPLQGSSGLLQSTLAPNLPRFPELCGDGQLCREYAAGPWERIQRAAEDAYDRTSACTFTTFVGYEYTGLPSLSNYHRNVIFRNANVTELPVTYYEAPLDSALWAQLNASCTAARGCDYLTIPHNSNLANGRFDPYRELDGSLEVRRAYAETRLAREPLIEIFQHKGNSECVNGLSSVLGPPDELCNFENVRSIGQTRGATVLDDEGNAARETVTLEECADGEIGQGGMLGAGCIADSDYVRSALLQGLSEAREIGVNPVKLGIVAATDTHMATPGGTMERGWVGHVRLEETVQQRLQPGLMTSGIDGNPGGLAGVWATENSRDAIFDAMLRREAFGTSGTRIAPRFFAAWDYPDTLCKSVDRLEQAYTGGVPMGGDLSAASAGAAPVFLITAHRDPDSAPLQQLQLIKGWVDADGQRHNQVITVAGDANNGAGVDPNTGEPVGEGAAELCAVVRDESFDPDEHAYYYMRAVENPTPRWSWHDCQSLAEGTRPEVCADDSLAWTIQEMAWTSPIWYTP